MTDKTLNRLIFIGATLALIALLGSKAHATCSPSTVGASGQCTASSGANSPVSASTSHSQSAAQAAAQSASRAAAASRSAATGGAATSNAQGGQGGQGGAASADGIQSTTIGGDSYSAPRQAPPAFAGNVQPTASCKNAINAGASTPFGGVAFGKGTKDAECDLREAARIFYQMGDRADAIALLCQSEAAKSLKQCGVTPPEFVAPIARVEPQLLPLAVTIQEPVSQIPPAAVRKATRKAAVALCKMPK